MARVTSRGGAYCHMCSSPKILYFMVYVLPIRVLFLTVTCVVNIADQRETTCATWFYPHFQHKKRQINVSSFTVIIFTYTLKHMFLHVFLCRLLFLRHSLSLPAFCYLPLLYFCFLFIMVLALAGCGLK